MKARKPDGSRWFTPTPAELMDRWLEQPELLDWLRRTVLLTLSVLEAKQTAQVVAALISDLAPRAALKYVELTGKVAALRAKRRTPSECRSCGLYWAPWIHGPPVGEPCPSCGRPVDRFRSELN